MEDLSSTILKKPIAKEEENFDAALRPKTWSSFIGQEKLKKNLRIIIEAAKKRGEKHLEHILLHGNSGLGKTSLSYLVAKELQGGIKTIAGPTLKNVGDLAAILTNIQEGDVLFCDECHRMNKMIEEFLYPALEDFKLHLILGKGPLARTMEIPLPKFTFIGATTRPSLISAPLRNRFGATFQLNFYDNSDIKNIIKRSSQLLNIEIKEEAIDIIAKCSRFTPRVANRLLKRVRDFAQIEGNGVIDEEISKKTMEFLEIDDLGLENSDRKILGAIISKFGGGPVGVQSLAAATSEEEETIEDIYEPYLMQMGLVDRTPKGRVATKLAYLHLGLKPKKSQDALM